MNRFVNGAIASHADHAIAGHTAAGRTLSVIDRGIAPHDELYRSAMDCWSAHGPDGMTAFMRAVQKRLQNGSP